VAKNERREIAHAALILAFASQFSHALPDFMRNRWKSGDIRYKPTALVSNFGESPMGPFAAVRKQID
jgi:hypothetical protein